MFENRYKSYASKSTAYSISKKSELMSCHINYVFNSSHANTMTKLDSLILQVLDYENSQNTLLYKYI